MKCFYDGSERFLKLKKDGKIRVEIITEGVLFAKFVYTTQLHFAFSLAEKISVDMKKDNGNFVCEVALGKEPIRYWFEFIGEKEKVYFSTEGIVGQHDKNFDKDFIIVPEFDTPNWSKGAVWYQIMPDSFFNGDTLLNKSDSNGTSVNVWGQARRGMNDYYGGDLYGIARKVEYLKSLSVDVVSINPVWMSTHNAGYGSFDIEQVDATFGGVNALEYLIDVLHANGIKLVLDGVFQYYHKYGRMYNEAKIFPLEAVAQGDKTYADVFVNDCIGDPIIGTWGHPTVDFSSNTAREILTGKNSPIQRYLKLGADGWRLDVGNTYEGSDQDRYGACDTALGVIYDAVKTVGKDKLVLTEHAWGEMFTSGKCESKWNYDFGYAIRDWVSNRINNKDAEKRLKTAIFSLPLPVAQSSFNFLTTHDLSRILRYTDGNITALKSALAVQFAFLGSPSIYSGDEIGTMGVPAEFVNDAAPTSFGSFEWNEEKQNKDILGVYKTLTVLRKQKRELFALGVCLSCACGKNAIAVVRSYGDDTVVAVGNMGSGEQICLDLPLVADGLYTDIINGNTVVAKGGKFESYIPCGCAFFAKDISCQYLNGFQAVGEVSYINGIYRLGANGKMEEKLYGCYDIEAEGCAKVQFGSITVYENEVRVLGKKYAKTGKVHIKRNENDCVTIMDCLGGIANVKIDDPYTVPLIIEGKGEIAFSVNNNKVIKLIADNEHGFSGMFDYVNGKKQTGHIDGDFSVTVLFKDEGSLEIFTDGASIGLKTTRKEVTFYRNIQDVYEILGTGETSKKLLLQRIDDNISVYIEKSGKFVMLGNVKANYSSSKIRIDGDIENMLFGDGKGQICPQSTGNIGFSAETSSLSQKLFGLKKSLGEWQYCAEGIKLISDFGELITNREYENFEIFFTLSGSLDLIIGKIKLPFVSVGNRNYSVKRKGNEIRIYSGLPLKHEQTVKTVGDKQVVSFFMKGKGARLLNFWVQDYQSEWVINRGKGYFNKKGELRFICDSGDFWARSSVSFSNFYFSANIRFNKAESKADGDFSVLLGHSPYSNNKTGIAVRVFHSGRIEILQDGKTLDATDMEELDVNSFFLRISKEEKRMVVSVAPSYYDRKERVVLKCELPHITGGALSFYGRNISGAVSDFVATFKPEGNINKAVKIAKPTYIWLC